MKNQTFYITVLLLIVAMMPLYAAPPQQQTQPSDLEVLSSFENTLAQIVNQSKPAIVNLTMSKPAGKISEPEESFSGGCGFIFRKEGYIITNAHVVEGAISFRVELFEGGSFDARLVGADKLTDIAVLKIEGDREFPFLLMADPKDVRVGQFAIAIGHPIGFQYTVTSGIVGGKGRCFHGNNNLFQYHYNYIQTDAWINPGSSGGPLLNIKGEVIGVTALNPGEGSTLAVDGGLAKQIAHQLMVHGRVIRGYFDVQLHSVSQGFVVVEAFPNKTVSRSNLRRDDIIVEFDGEKVSNLIAFERRVMDYQIGQQCALKVLRNGKEITLHVAIDEMPPELTGRAVPTTAAAWQILGVAVQELTANAHQRYAYLTATDRGILVEKVRPESPSSTANVPRGALIVAINGQKIVDPQTLETFFQTAQDISKITLDIIGINGKEKVTLQL